MGFRTSTSTDSGSIGVSSENITVPPGVVTDDTIYIACLTAAVTGGHSATGFTADLSGFSLGTSGRASLLRGTGFKDGDVISVANGATGITCLLLVAEDRTTVEDVIGSNAASATVQTSVAPSLTTTQPNEQVGAWFFGLKSTALSFSSVDVGTVRASVGGGGNTRWPCIAYSDRLVAAAGASGTVTGTFSAGTLLGSTSIQEALKALAPVPAMRPRTPARPLARPMGAVFI